MLRSAYFTDFKGGSKILFWGDVHAMHQLANLLNASSVGTRPLVLNSFVIAVDGRTIAIQTKPSCLGMRAIGNEFEWALDSQTMTEFAKSIEILAESGQPGHQYLICNVDGEIDVMASCAEYPDDLRPNP